MRNALQRLEEGVQAYGGSYSSVTYSGNIRNEIGVMRLSCNEITMSDRFEKQKLFGTDCSKNCSCERLILRDVYTSGGKESAQLSKLLDVLPSLCENAVNSGLA